MEPVQGSEPVFVTILIRFTEELNKRLIGVVVEISTAPAEGLKEFKENVSV